MDNKDFPKELLYNRDYSWARIEGDVATLGLIKPSADRIKEFVFIQLPKTGQMIQAGEKYVSLEALKWSGHLSSPLSGEIIEVHEELFDDPAVINRDPYGQGWIAKLKLSRPEEKEGLLAAEAAAGQLVINK